MITPDIREPFALSEGDKRNPVWLRLQEELKARRQELSTKLEQPQPEIDTAIIRGQLRFCKEMLRLGETELPPQDG